MTYVKVLQPVYTMVDIDGEYEMDPSAPQDSSFLYNSGLMTFEFTKKNQATSHSWDGREEWTFEMDENQIQLFGARDTLFGEFNKTQIILSSTLDDRPTFYHFEKLNERKLSTVSLDSNTYSISIQDHIFSDNQITFTSDSTQVITNTAESKSKKFFTYSLNQMNAFEYDLYPKEGSAFKQELGTVYLFKTGRKEIKGIFYPIYDGLEVPEKKILTLTPVSK